MAKNANLHGAKRAKQDEFYTQWADIEKEMNAYLDYNKDVFKGKTILLPCDDPEWSNFTKFFALRFQDYGIKKLISTSYAPKSNMEGQFYKPEPTLFNHDQYDEAKDYERGKIFVLDGTDKNNDGRVNIEDFTWEYLQGDGDFRSDEIKALRDEADMVITNPPFSLFREFVAWLIEGEVEFAVIGNKNAVTYKEIFPLIKDNKLWLGLDKPKDFISPYKDVSVNGLCWWFTNLEHGRRHEPLQLMPMDENLRFNKRIIKNDNSYKSYDNYDAIEVPVTAGIPSDYEGVMGVPISFLDKYSPEQFEILGITTGRYEFEEDSHPTKRYINAVQHNSNGSTSNGSKVNTRATIVDSDPESTYYTADNQSKPMIIVYARILIRHINSAAQGA